MTNIRKVISKCFYLILLLNLIEFNYAELEINNLTQYLFQSIQLEHFLPGINLATDDNMLPNDIQCLDELHAIRNSVENWEPWALQSVKKNK